MYLIQFALPATQEKLVGFYNILKSYRKIQGVLLSMLALHVASCCSSLKFSLALFSEAPGNGSGPQGQGPVLVLILNITWGNLASNRKG